MKQKKCIVLLYQGVILSDHSAMGLWDDAFMISRRLNWECFCFSTSLSCRFFSTLRMKPSQISILLSLLVFVMSYLAFHQSHSVIYICDTFRSKSLWYVWVYVIVQIWNRFEKRDFLALNTLTLRWKCMFSSLSNRIFFLNTTLDQARKPPFYFLQNTGNVAFLFSLHENFGHRSRAWTSHLLAAVIAF